MTFPVLPSWKFRCQIYILWCWCLYFISGFAYGIPGRPIRLKCGDAIEYHREELGWRYGSTPVASGVYTNGVLTNVSYYNKLADGRAELSLNGSLTIRTYEDGDSGSYRCMSEYRLAWTSIHDLCMYNLYIYDVRFISSTLYITQNL